jgi:Lipocalin-like domain
MRAIAISVLAFAILTSGVAICASSPASADLTGAWHLVSVETIRPNGEIIYPFYGRHPQGLIIYDPTGWMSVQIVSDPKPAVPTGNSREAFTSASGAEKAIAADGYYAYFGTYTVDTSASTVTHHLRDSLYPGERGQDFVRHYSIEHGRLTLVAKLHEMGEEHQRRLIWQRAADANSSAAAGKAR